MKLLSFGLEGRYKSLQDKVFDFRKANGGVIAFIGLNGSGKSQLLELIAESFAYLERYLRHDFKCGDWICGASITITYSNPVFDSENLSCEYRIEISCVGGVDVYRDGEQVDVSSAYLDGLEEQILPSHIVGYSSGLNENLQVSFMKNAVRYLDVVKIKGAWENKLEEINDLKVMKDKFFTDLDSEKIEKEFLRYYDYYQKRNPYIFAGNPGKFSLSDSVEIGVRPTPLPRMKYLDGDVTTLMMISLGMLEEVEQRAIWVGLNRCLSVGAAVIRYDLRKFRHEVGVLQDLSKLIRCVGGVDGGNFSPVNGASLTSEEFFNKYEVDYLAGEITVDFSNPVIRNEISEGFIEPVYLFEKLYRMHILSFDFLPGETKKKLRTPGFVGGVRKPQKWKSPIQVISLKVNDGNRLIDFDDLSDGECQLIQTLSVSAIYRDSRVLFLMDEPETHLNPSWRTFYHSYLEKVAFSGKKAVQFFISTHSPFMISSLKKESVYHFKRGFDGLVGAEKVATETYGASFDVIIKDLFDLRSLISQSVIDDIREELNKGNAHASQWIQNNLGLSAEKAYLIRKLKD